jgi:hypothetical protein
MAIAKNIIINSHNPTLVVNRIGGVMVRMLTLSMVDLGFKPWSAQTKDYKIGICYFSAKKEDL